MFDFTEVDVNESYDLIPKGVYPVLIEEAIWNENKARTGEYLKVRFSIVGDKYTGKKVWGMFNLIHTNAQAVDIAKREITQLLIAVGNSKDSLKGLNKETLIAKILNKVVDAQIYIKEGTNGYESSNAIRGYKKGTKVSPAVSITEIEIPF
jgi:hypothetical protein